MIPVGSVSSISLLFIHFALLHPAPRSIQIELLPLCLWWLVGSLLLLPIHEGLHWLGALVAGVPASRIRFGIRRRGLVPYCKVDDDMTVAHLRLMGAAPLIMTGVAASGVVLATGSLLWALILTTAIAISGGDLLMLWTLRKYRSDDTCRDGDDIFTAIILRNEDDGS